MYETPGMDDIEQAIETTIERMKKSRSVASMNIANGMERASKNRMKTANAYLDFSKWHLEHRLSSMILDLRFRWPFPWPSYCSHIVHAVLA
jgi:hypothetical protein